jgi:hypothetical protein
MISIYHKSRMSLPHHFLKSIRSIHLYLGVFTAPALLFFAITGGLQTFSLHETTRGSDYKPPAWLASAAQLHKKQTTVMPQRRPRPGGEAAPATAIQDPKTSAAGASDAKTTPRQDRPVEAAPMPARKNLLPMKIFFALVAASLLVSTLTGLYMAYRFNRKPRLLGAIFCAGIAVPILLSLF